MSQFCILEQGGEEKSQASEGKRDSYVIPLIYLRAKPIYFIEIGKIRRTKVMPLYIRT